MEASGTTKQLLLHKIGRLKGQQARASMV